MSRAPRLPLFAVCPPGLESLMAAELAQLGIRHPRLRMGGVSFDATTRQLYAANLWLRTATRLVLRAGRFRARTFAEFEEGVAALPWDQWLGPDTRVKPRVSSSGSRLYHTGALAERLLRVIGRAEAPTDPNSSDGPTQLVVVRVTHDEVTISIDSSGEALHRRGWRQQTAKAPLRESLAAAMLLSAGWAQPPATEASITETPAPTDRPVTLIDPMCGSGTIVIEAALLARGLPPGRDRTFAFEQWPSFEPGTWASVVGAARTARPAGAGDPALLVGRDRDAGAIAAAGANARRAGVRDGLNLDLSLTLDLGVAALSHLERPTGADTGWLISNPPYGSRVRGGSDLRDLYARFGDVARRHFEGWKVGLLVANPTLARQTRLRFEEQWRSTNGGIPVHFLTATA